MADISLIQDDTLDESDEGVFEQSDIGQLESSVCPLLRIEKYGCSENIYDKQMVPRILLDIFRTAPEDVLTKQLPLLMRAIIDIYNSSEVMLKTDLLEELPNIAITAVECSNRVPELNSILGDYLLPLVVRNLGVNNNRVRRAAHHTLFALIQKGLITKQQAEVQICPTVLSLSSMHSPTDYFTIAVMLMSRLAHFLGRDATERVFLTRFTQLCSSNLFYVRKMCASNFIYFCAVIGVDAYERILLPSYLALCEDEVWGVRKSCAEVAVSVSCMCPSKQRHATLAPVFARLLTDESRWVRMSAFQALGPFISTFADPTIIRFEYNIDGEPYLVNYNGTEFKINPTYTETSIVRAEWDGEEEKNEDASQSTCNKQWFKDTLSDEDVSGNDLFLQLDNILNPSFENEEEIRKIALFISPNEAEDNVFGCDKLDNSIIEDVANSSNLSNEGNLSTNHFPLPTAKDISDHLINKNNNCHQNENLEQYNCYNYWYVSPEVPLDPEIVNNNENKFNEESKVEKLVVPHSKSDQEKLEDLDLLLIGNIQNLSIAHEEAKIDEIPKENEETVTVIQEPPQKIVPQILIDHFISMTDLTLASKTDNEMAYHCAYSLPAVVLTLGRDHWHLLKETVEILAANMHYKVRRTVASSLHELALILGQEIATQDLAPLFEDFLKDLDEVRIGILKHLAPFLKLIHPSKRKLYLPRLVEFLEIENKANWRFRHEFAEQMLVAVSLFHPSDAFKYIRFFAHELLCDNVAAVREVALLLVTELIRHVSSDRSLLTKLLFKLAEKFAHSKKWKQRQSFALLCSHFLISGSLLSEVFASEVMPYLLDLSWDPVANVRLVVARTISQAIITNEYFSDSNNQYYDGLDTVLRRLKSDKDRDVRQSASMQVITKY